MLRSYNLSDTSEDIKGIAFERFLGKTFRGEIGQFFTPRTIVEFMVRMVDPKEGDIICDPASGSGGFLIRFFEIVRQQILADADRSTGISSPRSRPTRSSLREEGRPCSAPSTTKSKTQIDHNREGFAALEPRQSLYLRD